MILEMYKLRDGKEYQILNYGLNPLDRIIIIDNQTTFINEGYDNNKTFMPIQLEPAYIYIHNDIFEKIQI